MPEKKVQFLEHQINIFQRTIVPKAMIHMKKKLINLKQSFIKYEFIISIYVNRDSKSNDRNESIFVKFYSDYSKGLLIFKMFLKKKCTDTYYFYYKSCIF